MTIDITTRDLLISLASHMAYMQGQLEARHELDDPKDYYWYRESVLLRQKVADHLAAEAQQPSSSLTELRSSPEPAAVIGQPRPMDEDWDALVKEIAHWGNPAPLPPADGEVAELAAWLQEKADDYECRMRTDFRALCAELADAYLRTLEHINNSTWLGYEPSDDPLLQRARASLADEPAAPAPPADGEVAELPPRPPLMTPPVHPALERYGITWDGSPDKSLLTRMADGYWTPWHVAAELLQRQALVPVSVSERPWEREGWCDAEGRCWWGTPGFVNSYTVAQSAQWRLSTPDDRFGSELLCLPAHALPQPEVGE